MVVTIGVDLVETERIKHALVRFEDRFENRILHPQERIAWTNGRRRIEYLAARFAAKEAVSKALLSGIGKVTFHDIVIVKNDVGAPLLALKGVGLARQKELGISTWHLTITHTKDYALAMVVAES